MKATIKNRVTLKEIENRKTMEVMIKPQLVLGKDPQN